MEETLGLEYAILCVGISLKIWLSVISCGFIIHMPAIVVKICWMDSTMQCIIYF